MPSAWVSAVTEQDFEKEVIEKSRQTPVVVDFWAPTCGPCRMLAPILEKLIDQRQGEVLLAKVNIDEEQGLAVQFGIQGIPLVVGFRDGKPHLMFEGLIPERQIAEFLDRLSPSQADRAAKSAADLEQKDPAAAEKLYRQALADNPRQESAILGLARLLLARNDLDEAEKLLDDVGPGSEQGQEAERLAAQLWLKKTAREFPDEETLRQQLQANPKQTEPLYQLGCVQAAAERYQDALATLWQAAQQTRKLAAGQVREAMVKIFQVVGVRSELADDYRDKLTSLLY